MAVRRTFDKSKPSGDQTRFSLKSLSGCPLIAAEGEAEVTSIYPNMRQRDILQKLMQGEWTPYRRLLPAGNMALEVLLSRGWIEHRTAEDSGLS